VAGEDLALGGGEFLSRVAHRTDPRDARRRRDGHAWAAHFTASLIVFSANYRALYFVVLAYAAYVFETRRAIAAQTVFACAGLALGLAVAEDGLAGVTEIFIFVPALALVTLLIAYLNEQLAASRNAYREFATETIDVALRIRTSAGAGRGLFAPPQVTLEELERTAAALHLPG
jgi:hypothetical protein